MIFNSVTFLVFLAIVVSLYFVLPKAPRLAMLCMSSIVFYGFWRWDYVWLMLFTLFLDYGCAIGIESTSRPILKKCWLMCSIISNLGVLFFFKYLTFTIVNVDSVFELCGIPLQIPCPNILLPLGISFYTFQSMSYTIDVYRGFIRAERDPIMFCTFITFFPQLVAGPILRAQEVIPWLQDRPPFQVDNLVIGLRRIVNGLFLKVVLADNIATLVDDGFMNPVEYLSALDCWTLSALFGFQIYFDFSAYSHIALGSAKLMGIDFPENFNFPFFAVSPRDFWKRWHISLSSWIRDYLYLPLCGVRVRDESVGGLSDATEAPRSTTLALILTWAIMGMWHGANWTFLYWGLFHATWIVAYRQLRPIIVLFPNWIRSPGGWLITLALAIASWTPFRADSLWQALRMHGTMLTPSAYLHLGLRENTYLVASAVLLAMCATYIFQSRGNTSLKHLPWLKLPLNSLAWGVQLALVFIFLRPVKQFIYFQF